MQNSLVESFFLLICLQMMRIFIKDIKRTSEYELHSHTQKREITLDLIIQTNKNVFAYVEHKIDIQI